MKCGHQPVFTRLLLFRPHNEGRSAAHGRSALNGTAARWNLEAELIDHSFGACAAC